MRKKFYFLVKCPGCGHQQKYMSYDSKILKGKTKKCVYCPRSFAVKDRVLKEIEG